MDGPDWEVFAPLAQLGLARAYAMQGNREDSRKAYDAFFNTWKDADPDIPILRQAKRNPVDEVILTKYSYHAPFETEPLRPVVAVQHTTSLPQSSSKPALRNQSHGRYLQHACPRNLGISKWQKNQERRYFGCPEFSRVR